MCYLLNSRLWLIAVAVTIAGLAGSVALAHEGRDVDDYNLVVGFLSEPAIEGQPNGVDLRVTKRGGENHEGHAMEMDGPGTAVDVEGLEDTLRVEVTHPESGASRTLTLRPVFMEPGHYAADFIPTAPGAYRFRFFGTINGMEVDEAFESGAGRFSDVEQASNLHFPEVLPTMRELESAVRGAQASAADAQDVAMSIEGKASSAGVVGIIGIALGAIGIAAGGVGVGIALKRR